MTCKGKGYRFLFILTFVMISLLLTPQAFANDGEDNTSADLISLVKEFESEGQFSNGSAVRALTMHLTAVSLFEKQEATNKVVEHMNSFKILLNHQLDHQLITENAFNELTENTNAMIDKWNSITIVEDGQAQAVVLVAEDAHEEINRAAGILIDYVEKSTGAQLPIQTTEQWLNEGDGETIAIYIGESVSGEEAALVEALEDLNDQGFVILPTETTVTIAGPTVWGTLNGVYDFLERYLDIRWLMVGPDGEDVPPLTDVLIPLEDIIEEPAFSYRLISPTRGNPAETEGLVQAQNEWAQRNKLQGGYNRPVENQENIYSLFPVEKYGETNPEFYPGGNPPAPGRTIQWQPCYSEPGTIDAAVAGIIEYFDENPEATSFSLGVNDERGFCEEDPNHPHYPGEFNSIGSLHMSEIYYAWVNEVVERVLEVYPDKWFGLLAYQSVMDPPSFPLHERVVPTITKDRMAWIDEDVRAEGHRQMEAWNEVASQVLWYDYMYGSIYVLPRIYNHVMAENFRYAHENQVMGNYIEMYQNAGDGPKAWLAAQLQWDPYQDEDELLQEWYERAVGPEAASDLAAVYERWEGFWTERIKGSAWFERRKGTTYLAFDDQHYLHLVTEEDIEETMSLLESVVEKTQTDQQKRRAEIIQRVFEFYEATIRSFPYETDPLEDEAAALALLDNMEFVLDERIQMANKRRDLYEEFRDDMNLIFRTSRWYDWSGWNRFEFWNLVDYMKEHEKSGGPVTDRVHELANRSEASNLRTFSRLLQEATLGLFSITTNSSFEDGDETATSWARWVTSGATIKRVEGFSYTGDASLLVEGMQRGGPHQTFPVKPGLVSAQLQFYTPAGTEQGTVRLVMNLKNDQGQTLASITSFETRERSTTLPQLAPNAGKWSSAVLLDEIPETVNGDAVTQAQLIVTIDNAQGAQLYIDDVVVYQLRDDLVNPHTFWTLVDYIQEHEPNGGPMLQQVSGIAASEEPSQERDYARLLLEVLDGTIWVTSLIQNSSFEDGSETAPPWTLNWRSAGAVMQRIEGVAHTGDASLLINNMQRGGPQQFMTMDAGLTVAQLHYYTPADTAAGTITLSLSAQNSQGASLGSFSTGPQALSSSAGEWTALRLLADIPDEVNGEEVARVRLLVTVDGAQDTQVYIDDVLVSQLREQLVTPNIFWTLVDYIEEHEPNGGPLLQQVAGRAASEEPSEERLYARLLLGVIDGTIWEHSLLRNGSFEEGDEAAPPWSLNWRSSGAVTKRIEGVSHTGDASLHIHNMQRGGPQQFFSVEPGPTVAQLHYYTPADTEAGTITMALTAQNSQGASLGSFSTGPRALSPTAGEWSPLRLLADIPDEVNGEEVTRIRILITIDNAQDTEVYVDDVAVSPAQS